MLRIFLFLSLMISGSLVKAQLRPGFDPHEFLDMMRICGQQLDTLRPDMPHHYHMVYRSRIGELKNRWDLWLNENENTAVISIHGTTREFPSWMENFYSAMIPARGVLQLNDSTKINYRFADDSMAAVHAGWAIGLCSMLPDIERHILDYHQKGIRQFIIMGHSQGGALAFLLRSSLHYDMQEQKLPADLQIKTYCSAAPKPGNLYYAYDYDFITREGWGFTIVSTADWVPETPFSVQQVNDFSPVNPFRNVQLALNGQPFMARLYLKHAYKKMNNGTTDASGYFKEYLGRDVFKMVRKYLPQLKEPHYFPSMNYNRAGIPIVLKADSAYYQLFSNKAQYVFTHHHFAPYYWLMERYYLGKEPKAD